MMPTRGIGSAKQGVALATVVFKSNEGSLAPPPQMLLFSPRPGLRASALLQSFGVQPV